MENILQANAPRFEFSVEGIELLVVDVTLEERFSAPFVSVLGLASEDEIKFEDVIGKPGLLVLESIDTDRYLHGVVDKFVLTGTSGRFFLYSARLVPQIQLLALEQDCRIFQEMSVPDIVQEVLSETGITSDLVDVRLQGKYEPREYCVQYRETDLAFVSRLLEEEGIFYYFEHFQDRHVMILGDGTVNYQDIAGQKEVVFNSGGGMIAEEEAVISFQLSKQILTGKYSQRDFNFEKPALDLTSDNSDQENKNLEVFDYPGGYATTEDGKRLAQVRLQQAVMYKEQAEGKSVVPRFMPGFTFVLDGHSMYPCNQEYVLTRIVHKGAQPQVLAEHAPEGAGTSYVNEFIAVPASVAIRPERSMIKPVVEGVQTAIVTGPSGEEIYTDEYGRVKVQFHWDRLGKNDEKSSCWVRVSQVWAGNEWGAMHIPRIGQEVIVDFLEGDPDRPIITGRVYHGTNQPPHKLPDEKTKSTLMSKTTPNAKTHNELLMEDKAGETYVVLSNAYGHKLIMDEKEQYICIETRDGNKIIFDDKNKHINALTTDNHNILISDEKKKISVTSTQGHTLEIDDENKKIFARTVDGNSITMDDPGKKIEIATEAGGHSMVMDEKTVNFVTGGGHSVVLSDGDGQGIKLEDSGGNMVQLDAGAGKLIIETQGGIDLTTQGDLNISATNIKLDATADLNMAGGANVSSEAGIEHKSKGTMLTAEGSATAEFKGGAKTAITGTIVMIN